MQYICDNIFCRDNPGNQGECLHYKEFGACDTKNKYDRQHKNSQNQRIKQLENGLLEIRKYIENSNADTERQIRHIRDMTYYLSYPEERKGER